MTPDSPNWTTGAQELAYKKNAPKPVELEDGELVTDPRALQAYLLLSQQAEKAIVRTETVSEEE